MAKGIVLGLTQWWLPCEESLTAQTESLAGFEFPTGFSGLDFRRLRVRCLGRRSAPPKDPFALAFVTLTTRLALLAHRATANNGILTARRATAIQRLPASDTGIRSSAGLASFCRECVLVLPATHIGRRNPATTHAMPHTTATGVTPNMTNLSLANSHYSRVFLRSCDLARIPSGARSRRSVSASAGDSRPTRRAWRRPFRGRRIRARQAPTADPQSFPETFTQSPRL